jgi:hypothetical protein
MGQLQAAAVARFASRWWRGGDPGIESRRELFTLFGEGPEAVATGGEVGLALSGVLTFEVGAEAEAEGEAEACFSFCRCSLRRREAPGVEEIMNVRVSRERKDRQRR